MIKIAKITAPLVRRMKEVTGDLYQEARDAKAAGKPVGYSTSNFIKELFEVFFDLNIIYPENHAQQRLQRTRGLFRFVKKQKA